MLTKKKKTLIVKRLLGCISVHLFSAFTNQCWINHAQNRVYSNIFNTFLLSVFAVAIEMY